MRLAGRTPDLLIIGGGPAGIAAALWAASLDLRPLLLEANARTGGQLHRIHFEPKNLPASQPGAGDALAGRAARQLDEAGIDVRTGARAATIEPAPDGGLRVRAADGALYTARAAIVATGLRRRRLEIPGESEFEGRGVSDSATRDLERLKGLDVTVIGGGDAAHENALLLAGAGCRVTLAVRGPVYARANFRASVAACGAIEVLSEARALAILGGAQVEAVRFATPTGEIERRTSSVIVKIGQLPNTEWCREALVCDEEGYLRVDGELGTSMPAVWGAGDVVRAGVPGIAVALGQGALAAAAARRHMAENWSGGGTL